MKRVIQLASRYVVALVFSLDLMANVSTIARSCNPTLAPTTNIPQQTITESTPLPKSNISLDFCIHLASYRLITKVRLGDEDR